MRLKRGIISVRGDEDSVETFKISKLLDEDATQQDAFEPIKRMLAKILSDGLNCSIIAHGSTGSGKTYTISGGE